MCIRLYPNRWLFQGVVNWSSRPSQGLFALRSEMSSCFCGCGNEHIKQTKDNINSNILFKSMYFGVHCLNYDKHDINH